MEKYYLVLIILFPGEVWSSDVVDMGNYEIEGELRRPSLNYINTDRHFDRLVDDTIVTDLKKLEDSLTKVDLTDPEDFYLDSKGNL